MLPLSHQAPRPRHRQPKPERTSATRSDYNSGMSVAPHSTSPALQSPEDPELWEIKPLGWRSLFSDRLLWLAITLSFLAHLILLAPHYGIKLPQRGDTPLLVSFRTASQPIAHNTPAPTQTTSKATVKAAPKNQPSRLTPTLAPKAPTSAPPTPSATAAGAPGSAPSGNRRVTLTPGMKDYRYSQYLEDWRRKVERIGAMNYPEEARGKFFGSLVLSVALRPDGSIDRLQIVRSSGNQVLDEAAKRIVTFAAPFAPFPPDIRKETDYLDITRTWNFTRGNALETR